MTGFLQSMGAGGGGILTVALLIALIPEAPSILVGSIFLMYSVATITTVIAYARKHLVDYRTGVILSLPTLPGIVIGTILENELPQSIFKVGLGILILVLAFIILRFKEEGIELLGNGRIRSESDLQAAKGSEASKIRIITDTTGRIFQYSPKFLIGCLMGVIVGLTNGFFGAGGGPMLTATTIAFVGLPPIVGVATSRITVTILNLVGLTAHMTFGTIDYLYGAILAAGSFLGSIIGVRVAFRLPSLLLRRILAVFLIGLGVYLTLSSIRL